MSSSIPVNPSVEDVKDYDTKQLITFLQGKNLGFSENDKINLYKEMVDGHAFVNMNIDIFLDFPFYLPYELAKNLDMLIDELNGQESSQEYLSEVDTSQFSSDLELLLWNNLFEEVNQFNFDNKPKFKRPQFMEYSNCFVEENTIAGEPDFVVHFISGNSSKFIMPIEIIMNHVLQEIGEQTFPDFYKSNENARKAIQQIYIYMTEAQLQYGVLSTYEFHWFLHRPDDEPSVLYVSKTLSLQSQSPPVLKTYAFTDFKYIDILGYGRSGKTLLCECEFCENTIALKCTDLSKTPYILEEMRKEVKIYKILFDIQGKYIPNLLCYGYYCGMYYAIGMTLVGTPLNNYNHITENQRNKCLLAIKEIHNRGILHNDIRNENILLNKDGDVYLIDFGMASYYQDAKGNEKLFKDEECKLINLLNNYTTIDTH
ncbi:kinase-like domain-containing protein [Glomus cerebriforme]|uniref:Kinase-like domain-containing protein n=1 Tax=Glomus cerebriforme TaxID=658196 RepID=A0A397SMF8_9GLOM|nr:kinase-like domain-containing protein [Glomus cerebriforme]